MKILSKMRIDYLPKSILKKCKWGGVNLNNCSHFYNSPLLMGLGGYLFTCFFHHFFFILHSSCALYRNCDRDDVCPSSACRGFYGLSHLNTSAL